MKNFALGMIVALGLVACSDSDGGGTGGGGGIQDAETTGTTSAGDGGGDSGGPTGTTASASTSTASGASTGSGSGCDGGPDAQKVCDAVEECDPGSLAGCLDEITEERCAMPTCTASYDAFLACTRALAEAGEWNDCPDYPDACAAELAEYDACIDGDPCPATADMFTICAAEEACGFGSDTCVQGLKSERCGYEEGSECRDLFEVYIGCVAEAADVGEWPECPSMPPAYCNDAWQGYASSCI